MFCVYVLLGYLARYVVLTFYPHDAIVSVVTAHNGSSYMLLLTSCMLFVLIGYIAAMLVRSRMGSNSRVAINSATLRATPYLFCVGLGVAIAFAVSMLISFGSLEAWLLASALRVREGFETVRFVGILLDLLVVISIVFLAVSQAGATRERQAARMGSIVLCGSCVLFLIANGGRGLLLQYIVSILIVIAATGRKRGMRNTRRSIVSGMIMVAIFPVVMELGVSLRHGAQKTGSLGVGEANSASLIGSIRSISSSFSAYDHFVLAHDFRHFQRTNQDVKYSDIFVSIVPRALWRDKPEPIALKMRRAYWGDSLGGIPPGFFGEAYIGGGLPLISVLSVMFGAVLGLFDRLSVILKSSPMGVAVCGVLLPMIAFYIPRGGLDLGFNKLLVTGAMLLFVHIFISLFATIRPVGLRPVG